MSFKAISTAVALVLVAGTASAQGISAGHQQLAASLGVNAADFSLTQLSQLQGAVNANDDDRVAFILNQAGADASRAAAFDAGTTGSVGNAQFEAKLGVEPGRFTTAELARLDRAYRTNDDETINFILSGASNDAASGNNAGKQQIAAQLGVNADDYTLTQLVQMLPRDLKSND